MDITIRDLIERGDSDLAAWAIDWLGIDLADQWDSLIAAGFQRK